MVRMETTNCNAAVLISQQNKLIMVFKMKVKGFFSGKLSFPQPNKLPADWSADHRSLFANVMDQNQKELSIDLTTGGKRKLCSFL